jgi:hypothetical protein
MAISATTLAPRLIALAVVGYCVWPSLTAFVSETASPPPAKLPAVETSLLSPKMPPQPARDPFQVGVVAPTAPPSKSPKAGEGVAASGPASAAGNVAVKPVNPLDGLSLDGTCIVGAHRLAVINGRLYAAREMLPASNSATPLKLVDVLPHKVLLEREGKTLELTYSNVASALVPSRGAEVHASPNGVVTGPNAKKLNAVTEAKSDGKSPTRDAGN